MYKELLSLKLIDYSQYEWTSLPIIWVNKDIKKVILTNHRCATLAANLTCKKYNYIKCESQNDFRKMVIEDIKEDIDNYKFYMFCKNPYSRAYSIFPGLMSIQDQLLYNFNTQFIADELNNMEEDGQSFLEKLKSKKYDDYLICCDLYLKCFNKYFHLMTKIYCDGHLMKQTDERIYSKLLLEKSTIIKLEDLNNDNISSIVKSLFYGNNLIKNHPTKYHFTKEQLLTPDYIKTINKYYKEDFELLGYDMM